MVAVRVERDSLGAVEISSQRYWGAQTERARRHFPAGGSAWRMPAALIHALGQVKCAAARANVELGVLPAALGNAIAAAALEVAGGRFDAHFPLCVFQSGSGTQTNMNANEVIANRACEFLGGQRGDHRLVHPNDHVNRSKSSNDVIPSAMHVAVRARAANHLMPALMGLGATLRKSAHRHADLVKIGRTHLQDAAPITLGQEIGSWATQLEQGQARLAHALLELRHVAVGATAVGTGLNAPAGFAAACTFHLCAITGDTFEPAADGAAALAAHEALLAVSAALRGLAAALLKIANDVRWLCSGPAGGIGELRIPHNEPGSSIMPGKVNPTQCEALAMVCMQVYGYDAAIAFGASQGNFQLNTCKPLIAHGVLDAIALLADAIHGFDTHCASGIEPVPAMIRDHLERDLMLVTALAPHLGYDAAASIAQAAADRGLSLRAAALASGLLDAAQFDAWVDPHAMARAQAR